MAFFVRPLTVYEERTVRQLLEQYQGDSTLSKRLKIIWLSHQRIKSGEISRQLEIMPATVLRWIKRFNQEGLGCLNDQLEDQPAPPVEKDRPPSTPDVTTGNPILYVRPLSQPDITALQELTNLYQARERTLKRFQAILLSNQLLSVSKISAEVGLSRAAVRFWIKEFNKSGFEKLETSSDRSWLSQQQAAHPLPKPASDSTLVFSERITAN